MNFGSQESQCFRDEVREVICYEAKQMETKIEPIFEKMH